MISKFSFQSIQGRLTFAILTSFIITGVFVALIFIYSTRIHQHEITQTMHKNLASHVVKEHLLFKKDGTPDIMAAKMIFMNLMVLGPNFEFYLLDDKGKVLAYSTKPDKIKLKQVDLTPLQQFDKAKSGKSQIVKPVFGDDPRSETRQKIFSASPILTESGELQGYLYVILGSEIYDKISDVVTGSKMIQWGLWIFLAGLSFFLLVVLWVTGLITRPLRVLTHDVAKLRKAGFASAEVEDKDETQALDKWCSDSRNEIHLLGCTFRQLVHTLKEQYDNVKTIDDLRKELLSHVSHDLRTPLASLLGYLETWELSQENMSDEESRQYISTAKKSAQKISKLVEQLFELAHLDSGSVNVNKESFAIAELVQDVLQKFKIIADQNNISLHVTPQDSSIKVMGDIEKLDRVFSNLIENALRHTNPGGAITVRLNDDSRFVAVEVSDTGIGIPTSDLPRVFDPHYKAGNSVRGNTAHGGLGLAITKKLLDLHQSKIEVRSKVDEGTTFQFQLQASGS